LVIPVETGSTLLLNMTALSHGNLEPVYKKSLNLFIIYTEKKSRIISKTNI
jgi:hypothetical protein